MVARGLGFQLRVAVEFGWMDLVIPGREGPLSCCEKRRKVVAYMGDSPFLVTVLVLYCTMGIQMPRRLWGAGELGVPLGAGLVS